MNTSTPIYTPNRNDPVDASPPAKGFLACIKRWLGRLWSFGRSIPSRLFALINRTHQVTQPIFDQQLSVASGGYAMYGTLPSSPPLERLASTIERKKEEDYAKEEKQLQEDIASNFVDSISQIPIPIPVPDPVSVSLPPSKPVLQLILDYFKIPLTTDNFLEQSFVFTKEGVDSGQDVGSLNGFYVVKKPFYNLQGTLVYEGEFKEGKFDGEGKLSYIKEDKTRVILEGTFANQKFIKGTFTTATHCYEGTFEEGMLNGSINYKTLDWQKEEEGKKRLYTETYQGEMQKGLPHGEGALQMIFNDASRQTLIGFFQEGGFRKGTISIQDLEQDEFIINAAYEKDHKGLGHGTLDLKKGIEDQNVVQYKGDLKGCLMHGEGELNMCFTHPYKEITFDPETKLPQLVSKTGKSQICLKGNFSEGEPSGEEIPFQITWPDGKIGDGKETKIVDDQRLFSVTLPDGLSYCGLKNEFNLFTLIGSGIISEEGQEVYQGPIQSGVAHGEGMLFDATSKKWVACKHELGRRIESEIASETPLNESKG